MRRTRRGLAVILAGVVLAAAGTATAAVVAKTTWIRPGHCITIAKHHVCARKAKTKTIRRTQTVTVAATTITQQVTVTTPPPPPAVAFTDGTYRVGAQIAPGTYQATGGSSCYWARLRGFSGGIGDIITNSFAGQSIVTIEPSDAGFESRDCGNWTKVG